MKYRKLGNTGLKVSEISLGCMTFGRNIDEEKSRSVLDAALDAGINVLDTADVYGKGTDNGNIMEHGESEEILGNILKERRQQIILATKVKNRVGLGVNDAGLSRYHIMQGVENSLRRLQTDYIDLYQVHGFDKETPLEETLGALDDLVRQGKVRYIGCSNYAAWQIAKSHGISAVQGLNKFVSVQPEYNILSRDIEKELLPFCASEGVGVLTYSPLMRGLLSGKYKNGAAFPSGTRAANGEKRLTMVMTEKNFKIVEQVREIADARGWTLPQFAIAWILHNPTVSSAIVGASRPEQLIESIKYIDEPLTQDELEAVDRICEEA